MATAKKAAATKSRTRIERKPLSAAAKKIIIGPLIFDENGNLIGIINGIIRDPYLKQLKESGISAAKLKTVFAQEKSVRNAAKEFVKQSKKFVNTIQKL